MIALISVKEEFLKMPRKVNSESLNIDRRIISRKLLSGEITEKDLQSLFKKLPDVADNVAEEIENPDEK
jgi:pantothenate kinase